MAKIVLISCVKSKLGTKAKARNLYTSTLFKLMLSYAESQKPDKIFILSAKYGLVGLEEELEPYEKTLNKATKEERLQWSRKVVEQLKEKADFESDEFVLLAGKNYLEFILPYLHKYSVPLEGMGIGKRLKYLKGNKNAIKVGQ
ncbi:MAG: hypothetical protein M1504_04165 [Candidatus Marsarchaeota archaeon]|nr:hypothetical protein [Candidatus Marsarchaeota archaeon]